jgi:hypothetical protein
MQQKPWRMGIGFMAGLMAGIATWWSSFEPGTGTFQRPQLVVVPAAIGILIVILRNRRRARLDISAQISKEKNK